MSFILDALRKSESERRRSAAPMLAGVPVEVTKPAVPVWMWVVIGLLALAVVLLGGAWWSTTRPAVTAPTAAVPQGLSEPSPERRAAADPAVLQDSVAATGPRAGAPLPAPADRVDAPLTTPGPTGSGPRPAAAAVASAAPPASASGRDPGAPSAVAPAVATAPAPPQDTSGASDASLRHQSLPTVAEASAAGVDLPPLTLELHVYHEQPASRWVYVNGARYTEGRRLASGPELVEIVPEGIVIRQAGREFLLLAQ